MHERLNESHEWGELGHVFLVREGLWIDLEGNATGSATFLGKGMYVVGEAAALNHMTCLGASHMFPEGEGLWEDSKGSATCKYKKIPLSPRHFKVGNCD